jgi:trans-aconitate methyltransferase
MPLAPIVRGFFGQYERTIADLYRSVFISLDDLAGKIGSWATASARILEVVCGEGAMTEQLSALFPEATIPAIDIMPRIGRLYQRRSHGVTFEMTPMQDIARDRPGQFDLVESATIAPWRNNYALVFAR